MSKRLVVVILLNQCLSVAGLLCLLFFGSPQSLYAQSDTFPGVDRERELARAEAYLTSFKNDSALAVASKLVETLESKGKIDTPFGIRAKLAEAMANEQDQQGSQAIQKLLDIARLSQDKNVWDVHVRASLALALLYEKIGREESSREQLDLAVATIVRHSLDSLYSYFAIRRSSWERLFGDRDLALFFAREALRTSVKHQQVLEEAIAHMLMNMLLPESSQNERMSHCLAAVRLYQQLGDHTGQSSMYGAISKIQTQRKNYRLALAYNDSTLMAANRAMAEGHEKLESIGSYYRFRSLIFKQMGQLDSALLTMQKGYDMELALKEEDVSDKIVEIDARYQNKYKQKQIDDQQLALRLKNNQLRLSAIIGFLVLTLAVGLFIGFRKQRRDKQQLIQQNTLIQDQAAQLKSLDAAKSRFFANVSHELRTPLSLIVGPITTLLKEYPQTDKQTILLKTAIRSARQLESMVKDLLDLRKLEVGKMPLYPEPTRLESFFRLHLDQFHSLTQWKNIHYSHDLQIDPELVAELDREKCRQILYNLLSNAFKFTPDQGKVEVMVWVQDDQLCIRVADTGPGIPPDEADHIFDPFYQASQKGGYLAGGTGIGLSICSDYIELMGGDIRVESRLGEGSVFHASWPVSFGKQSEIAVEAVPILALDELYQALGSIPESSVLKASLNSTSASKPTILVVEDNLGLQEYIGLILSEKYQILLAENGEVALQKIVSCPDSIDLVVSDLMMPVMDGYQLLEHLKSGDTTRHIPVVMLTAKTSSVDRLQALRIGVDDYMTKPFDEEELLVRIANLLKNQSVRKREALSENMDANTSPHLSETDRIWLESFERYIRDNLASDILTVFSLSDTFAMSESTLFRQLKRLTGLSTQQYLLEIRLNEARLLLEEGAYSSHAALASQVGYKDARTFSRSYKKRFGKLPTDYV